MLEVTVEQGHVKAVEQAGGKSLKFVSPGNSGVPDRIDLFPVPEKHRSIVSRYVRFTELKAPGKKLRPLQVWWQARLRGWGFSSEVVDG